MPLRSSGSPLLHFARTGLAVAAALLALAGCASAEDVASSQSDEPTSESGTDEPTDEPTDEKSEPPKEPSTPVPEVGDCRRLSRDAIYSGYSDAGSSTVKCATRHNTQTVYVTSAKGPLRKALARGNTKKIYETMLRDCRIRLASWTGADMGRLSRTTFGIVVGVPPSRDVELGARWIRCDASLNGANGQPTKLPKQTKGALRQNRSAYDLCVRGNFSRRGTNIVPCNKKHTYRAVASIRLGNPSKGYPGEKKVVRVLKGRCPAKASNIRGGSSRFGYTYPTKPQWSTSTGYGTCYAQTKN